MIHYTGTISETILGKFPIVLKREEAFPYGEKFRRARKAQSPKPTIAETAVLAGLSVTNYEAVEKSKSVKSAKIAAENLSRRWGIPERYFWDGKDTDPYGKFSTLAVNERVPEYDAFGEQVDIPLLTPQNSGKVFFEMNKGTAKARVLAGLAKQNEFAVKVGDAEMAPRFLPGNIVVLRPQAIYDDRCYVAAIDRSELHESAPRLYLRWYVYENGRFRLNARGEGKSFDANDLEIVGLVVGLKVGADEHYTIEVSGKGLPFEK